MSWATGTTLLLSLLYTSSLFSRLIRLVDYWTSVVRTLTDISFSTTARFTIERTWEVYRSSIK
jgi:hypothetical protein